MVFVEISWDPVPTKECFFGKNETSIQKDFVFPLLSTQHWPSVWAFKRWDQGALQGVGGIWRVFYCTLHSFLTKGGIVWGNPGTVIQDLCGSLDRVLQWHRLYSSSWAFSFFCWAPHHRADDVMVQAGWLMTADSWPALCASSDRLPSGHQSSPPPLPTSSIIPVVHFSAPQPTVCLCSVFPLNPPSFDTSSKTSNSALSFFLSIFLDMVVSMIVGMARLWRSPDFSFHLAPSSGWNFNQCNNCFMTKYQQN